MAAKRHDRGAGYAPAAKKRLHAHRTHMGTTSQSPADTLLSRLESVRPSGPGRWMARCPSHEDRTASLSIRETDDGRVLINPFCGCDASAVLAAVGLEFADLFPRELPGGGAVGRVPPFPWRDFAEHSRTALVAIGLGLRDLASGKPVVASDAEFLRRTADDLLALLDSIESVEGRR